MPNRVVSFCLSSLFILILTACGPSAEQVMATAKSIASTDVAQTLAAMPTNTPQPTATASFTPTVTSTPTPEASDTPTATLTLAPVSTVNLSPYGQPGMATYDAARANKSDKFTPLLLLNESSEVRIEFIITSPQYQDYIFSNSLGLVLPQASYTYMAWIGDKGPFNGSFTLNNADKYELVFFDNKINLRSP